GVAGAPAGTTIAVAELFAATPARRKFLRTPATEAAHVVDVITRLAAPNPRIAFRLEHDGREVLAVPAARGSCGPTSGSAQTRTRRSAGPGTASSCARRSTATRRSSCTAATRSPS